MIIDGPDSSPEPQDISTSRPGALAATAEDEHIDDDVEDDEDTDKDWEIVKVDVVEEVEDAWAGDCCCCCGGSGSCCDDGAGKSVPRLESKLVQGEKIADEVVLLYMVLLMSVIALLAAIAITVTLSLL